MVLLDQAGFRIGLRRGGVLLDLGSIGKGYALDRAAEVLREAGVESALIHGGTSTVVAIGAPPDMGAWKIALEVPRPDPHTGPDPLSSEPLAVVELVDAALSVSAVTGKGFTADGRFHGHVMDPRRGEPVSRAWMAGVVLSSATESDALSTALLVEGPGLLDSWERSGEPLRWIVVEPVEIPPFYRVVSSGIRRTTE